MADIKFGPSGFKFYGKVKDLEVLATALRSVGVEKIKDINDVDRINVAFQVILRSSDSRRDQ
jgi:hypothetical protein